MKEDHRMTPQEITSGVSDAHKRLDAALHEAREAALDIERLTEEGVHIGMVGHLKGKKAIHMARALTGSIAAAGEKSAEVHIFDFNVAQDKGTQTDPLTTVGGVVIMGGTR
jgi:hypothetical protein